MRKKDIGKGIKISKEDERRMKRRGDGTRLQTPKGLRAAVKRKLPHLVKAKKK